MLTYKVMECTLVQLTGLPIRHIRDYMRSARLDGSTVIFLHGIRLSFAHGEYGATWL